MMSHEDQIKEAGKRRPTGSRSSEPESRARRRAGQGPSSCALPAAPGLLVAHDLLKLIIGASLTRRSV